MAMEDLKLLEWSLISDELNERVLMVIERGWL